MISIGLKKKKKKKRDKFLNINVHNFVHRLIIKTTYTSVRFLHLKILGIRRMEFLVLACYIINAAIIGALVIFLVRHVSSSRQSIPNPKTTTKNKSPPPPPEAGGGWPIFGHLHLLAKLPHITLGNLAEKYGPIFTIRLGGKRAVVVSSWKLAKQMFTTYDVAVSSRPKFLAANYLGYDYAMFGFSPYGAYWRELRKLTSVELLSARRLELLKHVRVSEINTSINQLYKICEAGTNDGVSVTVEMKQWINDLSLNVVFRMVAGKRYFGALDDDDDNKKEESRKCQKVVRDFFYLLGIFIVADAIPCLRWLDIGGYEAKMKQTGEEMDRLVGDWLKEHRKIKKSGDLDFMDVMISLIDSAVLSDYDADTIIKSTCMVHIYVYTYIYFIYLTQYFKYNNFARFNIYRFLLGLYIFNKYIYIF